jgi:hypothetical protein
MFEWFIKSCIKFSVCSAILLFIYHIFVSQKLEEESVSNIKENE